MYPYAFTTITLSVAVPLYGDRPAPTEDQIKAAILRTVDGAENVHGPHGYFAVALDPTPAA